MQTVIAPDDLVPAFDYTSTVDGEPVEFHNGEPVTKGQEIQVDNETAESLIGQGWESARSRAAKGRKKTDEAPPEGVSEPADVPSVVKE